MYSRETYSTLFHIPQIGSNRKSQARYGIPWNPESDANNNCTNPHMSLSHQSNRYSLRNGNYPICLMINVKRKRKEEGSTLGIKFCCLYFFSQKIER